MATKKQQNNGTATEESPVVEVSSGEHPDYTATGELRKQTAKQKGRRKARGPRAVFYMAMVADEGTGRLTESCRADTRNQLYKKLQVIRDSGYLLAADVSVFRCRPA